MTEISRSTTGGLLPVEIVDDIVCHVLSSHYWSYFVDGSIIYQKGGEAIHSNEDATSSGALREDTGIWDPIVTMSAINVIFRSQTLQIGARLLGIPRAVDGRLLEHPNKITRRVFELRSRLNLAPTPELSPEECSIVPDDTAHPLLAPSHSPATYFPMANQSASNPWNDAGNLMSQVRLVFNSGYISQSPFLKGHIAVLVGKSALATLSFGEVVRTGMRFRHGDGDGNEGPAAQGGNFEAPNPTRVAGEMATERSPAAWALEMMNIVIPPLTFWNPKQASVHLMQGLFSVAYSTHTISAICGIIGVISSCTKLMGHLRAVEAIAGIDEDRRRSMQTATRACAMSLRQLYSCESNSYQTYKPLGVPAEAPSWPGHVIRHGEILRALVLAGPEDLFPLTIRWAILRAAVLWTIRVSIPELSSVFPDEVVKTLRDDVPKSDQKCWGTVEHSQWNGDRADLLALWLKYKKEYIVAFGMEKLECPPEEQDVF
ncbi:hypothetical protein M408DRAFT_327856 [Serendipita vermifera MAFF 305830]|uniref:Uncharacterized protein n=1 Tax=Serendipita vermifera MAFF 305830 TaxID=933852 RepID=A0A0C2XPQ1_SERVB|nr:hypothetical protein M408DRAFT_327856 [Serendipita vermifera MAFF 305830]